MSSSRADASSQDRSVDVLAAGYRFSDKFFALFVAAHFPVGLVLAYWYGGFWPMLFAGAVLSGGTLAATWLAPGAFLTRATVAVVLMAYSALFINQTHGLIEAHFHVFAVLAFLTFYRDWRIPALAGLAIFGQQVVFYFLQVKGVHVY
ncbi:MAG: hypothetical protein P3B98_07455, partial [Gemmatimonadota bacterium]|nr:hypothetical protein [Gemmatimonadota bacterium]